AARRSTRNALELQPFNRRARPSHRGGLGADAVSIRKAEIVRTARHVRHCVLFRGSSEVAADRPGISCRSLSGCRDQGPKIAPALGVRWSGLGLDDRGLRALPANAAEWR